MKYLFCVVIFCCSWCFDLSSVKGHLIEAVSEVQSASEAQAFDRRNSNGTYTYVDGTNGEPCRGPSGACRPAPDPDPT